MTIARVVFAASVASTLVFTATQALAFASKPAEPPKPTPNERNAAKVLNVGENVKTIKESVKINNENADRLQNLMKDVIKENNR